MLILLVSHCDECMANGLTNAVRHEFRNDRKVIARCS